MRSLSVAALRRGQGCRYKRFERRVIITCVIHLEGAELMFNV
jgi:hypothetical protein